MADEAFAQLLVEGSFLAEIHFALSFGQYGTPSYLTAVSPHFGPSGCRKLIGCGSGLMSRSVPPFTQLLPECLSFVLFLFSFLNPSGVRP